MIKGSFEGERPIVAHACKRRPCLKNVKRFITDVTYLQLPQAL